MIDKTNSFGQSEYDVEMLKEEDPSKSFDEDFSVVNTKHHIMATI